MKYRIDYIDGYYEVKRKRLFKWKVACHRQPARFLMLTNAQRFVKEMGG